LIDDDNSIDRIWVQTVHDLFHGNSTIAMCGGQNTGVYETEPPKWFWKIQGSFAIGTQMDNPGDITDTRGYLWGTGLSFRKSVYDRIRNNGFNPVLSDRIGPNLSSGGDSELCLAFILGGYRLWYSDRLQLLHYIPANRLSWDYAVRLFKGFGKSEFIFEIYRMVIAHSKLPFLKLYLGLIPYILIYFSWRIINHFRIRPGYVRYLSYLARKEYIVTAWKNIGNFKKIYRPIKGFENAMREE